MAKAARNTLSKIVTLTEDLNCIPQGTYRFLGKRGELLFFGLSNSVQFAVSSDAKRFFRQATRSAKLTRVEDFTSRYYKLLDAMKGVPFDPTKPITMCALSPAVAHELH